MKLKSGWLNAILIAVGLSTILVVTGLPPQASAQEKKVSVPPSELPDVIRKAIEEAFPNGQIIRIQKEVEGEDPGQYDVDIRSGSKEYEVEISPEGNVIESKERAPAETAPAPEQEKNGRILSLRRTAPSLPLAGIASLFSLLVINWYCKVVRKKW